MAISDVPFKEFQSPENLDIRIASLDFGFDLRDDNWPICITSDSKTLQASYDSRSGRRVVSGPIEEVIDHLRANGYNIVAPY